MLRRCHCDQPLVGRIVAEADLLAPRTEGERPRLARQHRPVEPIDPVPEPLVGRGEPRAGKVEGEKLERSVAIADVDVTDRPAGEVRESVAAAHVGANLVWIKVDDKVGMADRRLGQPVVAQEALLIVGGKRLALVLRHVGVEDVGIVEDPAAGADRDEQGGAGDQAGRAGEAWRHAPQPGLEPRFGAAPPQQVGENEQDEGDGGPVKPEPPARYPERAVAVEVGEGFLRLAAIEVEVVLEADVREDLRRDNVEHDHAPAGIFVRAQRLDENGQHGDQDQVDSGRQHVPEQPLADLEIRIAFEQLDQHRRQDADQQGGQQYQRNGDRLGHEERPIGQGRRVDDLVHLAVALAPDQLAGIINGNDDHDEGETAVEPRDQGKGDRIGGVPNNSLTSQRPPDAKQPQPSARRRPGCGTPGAFRSRCG